MTNNGSPTKHEKDNNPPQPKDGSLESITAIWAKSINNADGQPISFKVILDLIRTSVELKEKVELIRSKKDKDERKQLKASLLPWFSLAKFRNNHRSNPDFDETRYLKHDFDDVADVKSLKEKLRHDPTVMAAFNSPGNGVKAFYELEKPITDEEQYRLVYRHHSHACERKYGIKPDPNEEKAAQPCFFSYDQDAYVNPNHEKLPVPDLKQPKVEKPKAMPVIEAAIQGANEGERTFNLTRQIGFYMKKGLSKDQTLAHVTEWNRKNNPPLPDKKVKATVNDMYRRYDKTPVKYFEKDGSYFKTVVSKKEFHDVQVSTFTFQPKELLVLPNSDCLRCDITTNNGYTYRNILIENSDWHSKAKLLRAIGHQDCSFLGSENEVQALCSYINAMVEIRKTGTKTIGLFNDTWVTEEFNISASGIMNPPAIVPYDKGADAFYHKIRYAVLSDAEILEMAREFYSTILEINNPEVVMPWIGWLFATPLKPIIQAQLGGFPSVFVHGAQGTGKTSTSLVFMKLAGYKDPRPNVVTTKPFPMLKLLSSSNAIPVFLDEYKVHDMTEEQVENIHRFMRKSYNSELESKGRQDQTVEDYVISAPIVLMGEWDINEPAIKERVLVVRFTNAVKKDQKMQEAFKKLSGLQLEGFMPRYIQYALSQDVGAMLEDSMQIVRRTLDRSEIAPRIVNNLSVMVMGFKLFEGYAASLGITPPTVDVGKVLGVQLKEITGSTTGFVRSAVDQLIEELGIMWQKNEKQIEFMNPNVKEKPWWKIATVKETKVVAIRFDKVFPEFKEYAKRTSYEGELLDKISYMKLFAETEYIASTSHPVDFGGKKERCILINIEKAQSVDISLDGFVEVVTPVTE